MRELEKRATLDGIAYDFEALVDHHLGDSAIVLCRTEGGELRYASVEEWESSPLIPAAVASDDPGKLPECAPVTQSSTLDEKVAFVMALFRGRTDVYGEGYVGKSTKPGKLSYWPPCRQRWVRGICPRLSNPKAGCRDCDHPDYIPLTHEVVKAHCTGRRDERGRIQAVGIYVVEGDECHLLAADFDGPGWREAAAAYRDACRSHGLHPAVERSRSGNGAHVWVFVDGPVKASLARRVGEGLVSEARDACTAVSFRSYDRLFPLQDRVFATDLGSLIALPLQGEAVRKGNSVFVDDCFETLPDQCAFLSTLPKASAACIAALADEFGKDPVGLPQSTSKRLDPLRTEAQANVWAVGRAFDDVPASVGVTLSDGVHIDCSALPASVTNRLRRLAAFSNPEYARRRRLHLFVWDTPRIVDCCRPEGDEIVLPRGCTDAVLSTLREAGIEPLVTDGRTDGRSIHASFVGRLKDTQQPCRDELIKHELGVLVAPTGFGKSVIAASIIAARQVSTLVIVPNTTLLGQWRDRLAEFLKIEDEPPILLTPTGRRAKHQPGVVGIIGDGRFLRSGIVDVALPGSLLEKGDVHGQTVVGRYVAEYGMVIVDEAQHVPASQAMAVLDAVRARYVYAMTATPRRSDGLDRILYLECGPIRHEVAVADQIAEQAMRRILVPRLNHAHPDLEGRPTWHQLVDYISASEERNHQVASDAVRAMKRGRTPLVLTRRVEHARTLAGDIAGLLDALGATVILLVGSDDVSTRRRRLEEFKAVPHDMPLCVVATGSYVGEGFDLDRLDTLLLAGPVSFEELTTQWVGRIHRVREGKSETIVMDYVDLSIPMFNAEWHRRLRAYKKLGYEMAAEDDLALVGLEGRADPPGHLFSGKELLQVLEADLSDSSSRVVMASSWVKYSRVKELRQAVTCALARGVAVEVVLKEPKGDSTEWRQALTTLRDIGCTVRLSRGGEPLDVVVIDGSLVWSGDVAPLAYPRREHFSLRIANRELAKELEGVLGCGQ